MDFLLADEVKLWRYSLPLDAEISLRPGEAVSSREGIIVEAMLGGGSHFGEAAPLPGFSTESLSDAEEQLRHLVATAPNLDLSSASVFRGDLHPSVDFALWSIQASMQDEPLPEIPLCGLLNGEQDEMVADAVRMSRAGYRMVKIKVGRRPVSEDAGAVLRVAAATGDGVRIRLDANRAWSMSEAVRFASLTESVSGRMDFIEEPLSEPTADRLSMLSEESGMPVALDETIAESHAAILDSGRYAFAKAIVLKPQVVGASKSLACSRRGAMLGMKTVISASYESGVGTLGLLRFAAECAAHPLAAGLDTYRRLREDVLEERIKLEVPVFPGGMPKPPKLRYDALERI